MAVVAPMPSASVSMAVKGEDRRLPHLAESVRDILPQGLHGEPLPDTYAVKCGDVP